MSTRKIITGVLLGATAGAALGLLYAPAEGSKTRKSLMKKKEELKEMAENKVDKFLEGISAKNKSFTGHASAAAKNKINGKERARHVYISTNES